MLTSKICTTLDFDQDFYLPLVTGIGETKRYHRKQWEFVVIAQALKERACLEPGKRGLGFAVGKEPLPALFARFGCAVTATDQPPDDQAREHWGGTMLAEGIESIRKPEVCDDATFDRLVDFCPADMNAIPPAFHGAYDFLWSSCAFEHIGGLERGLDFVVHAMHCLKPGGWAVHTTEYNLSSNDHTLETPTLSLYRRRDIDALMQRLHALKHHLVPVSYQRGPHAYDWYVDTPPYKAEPVLHFLCGGFSATSLLLIIRKGMQ